MQEHAFQPSLLERFVDVKFAILVVPGNRKTQMREVYPDLMGAPGLEFGFDQAVTVIVT